MGLGEISALACATTWALALILLKKCGEKTPPLALGLFKNIIALIFLLPTVYLWEGGFFFEASTKDYILLIASGVLGIAVGDVLFLRGLNILGAGLTSIVDCLYSPLVIALSILFLNEQLSFIQFLGSALIIIAIFISIIERKRVNRTVSHLNKGELITGIVVSIISLLLMVVGLLIMKPILDKSPILWVLEVRLVAGTIGMIIFFLFLKNKKARLLAFFTSKNWLYIVPSAILSTYLAIILWVVGMKYAKVSIAAVLNQTSSIFTILLASVFLKETLTLKKIIGAIIAIIGVLIISFA